MSNDDDTQPSAMPEQPKTKELPAVSPIEIMLRHMQVSMESGFREMKADVALVSNDLGILKDRVGILEGERTKLSGGVRSLSVTDAEQAAQLAQERAAREAVAAKVDELAKSQEVQLAILSRLDKLATNPHVKLILAVAATALMSWAASKGLK